MEILETILAAGRDGKDAGVDVKRGMEPLTRDALLAALGLLNENLAAKGVSGEMCIFGGGVMFLAFNARLSPKDLDAVFQPATIIREAAEAVAEEMGIEPNWS